MTKEDLLVEVLWLIVPVVTAFNLPHLIATRIKEGTDRLNAPIFWFALPSALWLYFKFVF